MDKVGRRFWTKDPFGAELENGFLSGRGSGDDKGPTIAAYHALKLIKDMNLPQLICLSELLSPKAL